MYRPYKLILALFCGAFLNTTQADNSLIDANIFYTAPDAGGSDDFHTGKILSVNYNHYALPWLAVTSGFFASEEIADNTRTDIVGTYRPSIKTHGFTIGLRPEFIFSKRNKIYGHAGILLYKTSLKVEEYFAPGLPSGSSTEATDGNGYFISLGWAHSFTKKISFQFELKTLRQLDLYDGKTTAQNVFDMNYTGFSLGMAYAF